MANTELSKRIKELRIKRGMSQDQLADISGLSLRTIQRVESGDNTPRGDTLSRLATALQVTTEEIIDLQNIAHNQINSADNGSKRFFDDWKRPIIYYLLSIGILVISLLFESNIFLKISLVLCMIGILILVYSTIYQFSMKRWKVGFFTSAIVLLSIFGFSVFNTFKVTKVQGVQTTVSEK